MLIIGQRMNDFTVSAASIQWRAGKPDGAAILGVKEDENGTREYVTAMLPQHEIDRPEPAEHWAWGHYFHMGTHENAAADALQDWIERAGMGGAQGNPPKRVLFSVTAEAAQDLAGRDLTDHELDRIERALPQSSINDAIEIVVFNVAAPPDDEENDDDEWDVDDRTGAAAVRRPQLREE